MKPRWYQHEANEQTWEFLREESGDPCIVLPTGAGKSIVIAMLVQRCLSFHHQAIVLQHRKELITQNTEKLRILSPETKIGLYSAGLARKQTDEKVISAGIQSVHNKAHLFGQRSLIVIDEAQMISTKDGSMYERFIRELKEFNPRARVVGLTATPYRTGTGSICGEGKMFSGISFEAPTRQLISEGFLTPVTNAPTLSVDTSGMKIQGGEFVLAEMQRVFGTDENVTGACLETVALAAGRKSVLVFCAGVSHAEDVAKVIGAQTGEKVGVVTGETLPLIRSQLLADFKAGDLRWLVNCDVLTTGFDAPCIDCISIMRSTCSPGLFAQIIGRGLRIFEGKSDCIAEGQRVLTDQGLVEIQDVTTAMRVWDGIEFVPHDGVVLHGHKEVISYAGIECTPDHKLFTSDGWKAAEVCKANKIPIVVTGDGRTPIRKSCGYIRSDSEAGRANAPVHEHYLQEVPEDRAEGLGHTEEENRRLQQSTQVAVHQDGSHVHGAIPGCEVCGINLGQADPRRPDGPSDSRPILQPPITQAKRRVWDIVNAGPRNRFTCEGLLVSNCLVLDFGENIKRHGSIDDPEFGRAAVREGVSKKQQAALEKNGRGKQCPGCDIDVAPNARVCPGCGFAFPVNHKREADTESTLTGEYPEVEWQVIGAQAFRHIKRNDPHAPNTLRVEYQCIPMDANPSGDLVDTLMKLKKEWVCIAHEGYGRRKAVAWWDERCELEAPEDIDTALHWFDVGALRVPECIVTQREGAFDRIVRAYFEGERPDVNGLPLPTPFVPEEPEDEQAEDMADLSWMSI